MIIAKRGSNRAKQATYRDTANDGSANSAVNSGELHDAYERGYAVDDKDE